MSLVIIGDIGGTNARFELYNYEVISNSERSFYTCKERSARHKCFYQYSRLLEAIS
jgi:glucokinase